MDPLPKPREMLAARAAAEELFALLRSWFDIPETITLNLHGIDSAVGELGDPMLVMAMAMRKLQAFHLLTTPGVLTTTDVVLTVVQDLERALQQAPRLHLRLTAAATDWDAELAALDDADPVDTADDDDETRDGIAPGGDIERFKSAHQALREAARAVLQLSAGRIRRLE